MLRHPPVAAGTDVHRASALPYNLHGLETAWRRKTFEEYETTNAGWCPTRTSSRLLFAFFVVMYSVSSVNEGKYRTVGDSIKAAFESGQQYSHQPSPICGGRRKAKMINTDMASANEPVIRRMKEILKKIHPSLALRMPDIKIVETGNGTIMISLPESILFASG